MRNKPSDIFETPEASGFNEAMTHNEMPKDTVEKLLQGFRELAYDAGSTNIHAGGSRTEDIETYLKEALTTAHNKGFEVGRVEERNKMSKTIVAMSWDATNETPDAVRILKNLHDLVNPLPEGNI
jgi:hypothetical protein